MNELLMPAGLAIAGLLWFTTKTASNKGAWPIIRLIFGFSSVPYQSGDISRIGFGTPAAEREEISREIAEAETKNVIASINDELVEYGKLPFRLRMSYVLLRYFSLPYGEDSTVGQNIASITNEMLNAYSNGAYTEAQLEAIDAGVAEIYNILPEASTETTAFSIMIDYTVNKFDPTK